CTGDNIFIVTAGRVMTPPNDVGALCGITQGAVIELARQNGFEFAYEMMKPEQLYEADECFLTGTAAEIVPVVRIDGKAVGAGKPGEVTKKLMGFFRELVETDGVRY
ncbi:MAG: aminotransferase class IV, partial [Candidatus Omnitrophica bacterium]|nr:aminotransferase class IV [Candidatus Omnitrophota bacterium]